VLVFSIILTLASQCIGKTWTIKITQQCDVPPFTKCLTKNPLLYKQYQIIWAQKLGQLFSSSKYLHSTTLESRTISRPRCHSRHVSKLIAELCISSGQCRCQWCHLLQLPIWILTRHERQQFPFLLRNHQAPTPLSLLPCI